MQKTTLALAAAVCLAGCSHSGLATRDIPPAPAGTHIVDDQYGYLSCDVDWMRTHFSTGQREMAQRTFVYALMASNAYPDPEQYAIPGWRRFSRQESTSGLGVDDYVREGSNPEEIVVAFRGTNDGPDWRANLAFMEPWQHREAYEHVARLRQEHPGAHIAATGHSLGGALALNMSYRFADLPAYAFNSSPRAFFAADGIENPRVVVWETGEVLNGIRKPWLAARMQDKQAMNYNFMRYNWHNSLKPIREHSMYGLSRGLLLLAASNGDPVAREAFARTIEPAVATAADRQACGRMFAAMPALGAATR